MVLNIKIYFISCPNSKTCKYVWIQIGGLKPVKKTLAEKIREESYLAEAHHRGPASQPTWGLANLPVQ
jgi:hypothetical protein